MPAPSSSLTRRDFARLTGATLVGTALAPTILTARPRLGARILGHGDYRYRVDMEWGDLDPAKTPVKNCHEMVMDRRGRLIMITDETKNNVLVYDRSGRLLEAWGTEYPGGHGLTIWDAGGEEFLFISDFELGQVRKTTLDGRVLMTIEHPKTIGVYGEEDPFRPTETAIGPGGDIYVADGYGSQYILQYEADGTFVRAFGGPGDADDQFATAHGVAVDARRPGPPTLLCTSRAHNSFKRFTLDGTYLETIFLPGAFVCRPVIDGPNVYAGVCWSRLRYLNRTPESGFVTILDEHDRVVSNPGGTEPTYTDGRLNLMVQDVPVFKHCHDVCVDDDQNLYVCQWNAGQTYPIKLHRI
ncbi:6-bladed beta-propeller [Rhodothermaceae bacterium RA]|nr:6-bladed beta-propeller [Rhodothermaceae bacterium RA]